MNVTESTNSRRQEENDNVITRREKRSRKKCKSVRGRKLISWAISSIRCVEALYNIGQRLKEQRSFSIQHLANNVKIGKLGLENRKTLGDYVKENGILDESEGSYTRSRGTCSHRNPTTATIDRLVIMNPVDDMELANLRLYLCGPNCFDIERPTQRASTQQHEQLHAVLQLGLKWMRGEQSGDKVVLVFFTVNI
ncbi:unnamed protein product [Eruca vesicaria subsp. sativa]|uniref:Uncharacterized protein n=1 Tax=Eruca vesicaria subsp. sativa TaxID=29727 RepID=A0ABC8LUU6_ERUVS|nr:unnamed protein product [Eruca vesicaria subsp. sativa]